MNSRSLPNLRPMDTASFASRLIVLCMGVTSATISFAQDTSYIKPPITNWAHPPVAANLDDSSTAHATNPSTQNTADLIPPAPMSTAASHQRVATSTLDSGKQIQSALAPVHTSSLSGQPTQNMATLIRPATMPARSGCLAHCAVSAQQTHEHQEAAITPSTPTADIASETIRFIPKQASAPITQRAQPHSINAVQALFDLQASGRDSGNPVHLQGSDLSSSYKRFLNEGKNKSGEKHTKSPGVLTSPDTADLSNLGLQP